MAEQSAGLPRFVVQRHRATGDHFDLRLEVDGALVSWAVPKGPTLDPTKRRTAFRVGDHPMEYFHFEGVIPEGSYGAGDVVVWDTGTWELRKADEPRAALEAGELHAELYGEKLRGRIALVRRGGLGDREQWLLVHKRDEHAVEGWEPLDHPRSVLTGRTNEEVLADRDRLWRSDLPAAEAEVHLKPSESEVSDSLDALDELGAQGTWHVFGRDLKVTNLDKVLFPGRDDEPPVTKRELLRYAAAIAPTALPFLQGRALNMRRHPDGAETKGFWHKQRPDHAPDWVGAWDNPDADEGETSTYPVMDEPAAIVWAAQFGALEWHPWTSRTDQPHRPTYALVDLDPGEQTSWEDVLVLARLHRTAFEHVGVRAVPKVTGRRGIQIWVPVRRGPSFDDTRAWVEQLSRTVGAVVPELVSWKWEVRSRGGKARLDYTQNAINRTLVAPYSPRAAAGAPVSAPITWEELDDPALRPDGFTIRNVLDRIAEHGDLFRGALQQDQVLPRLG
ncbi:MAG: DNA_ligase_IV_Ku-like [uncultured Nocardioidaceae bacterium]|uniref:DNA_ligase_IV_Ku-like n=1 Tax=uncultured Nocardioidaceae bacterium TaxID=253824 RepID=A0A6J4N6U3_9ACTN|nr:MAG: DNA_ligase_IV_Ku-like [uncultured Nocardioidaceae bacterium]